MNCDECGAPLGPSPGIGQRVVCRSCGFSVEVFATWDEAQCSAKQDPPHQKQPHVTPNAVLARAETRMRGELSIAHALDNVRPTKELLHSAYEHLRKHGIAWR